MKETNVIVYLMTVKTTPVNAAIETIGSLYLKHESERLFLYVFSSEHLKIQFNQKIFMR